MIWAPHIYKSGQFDTLVCDSNVISVFLFFSKVCSDGFEFENLKKYICIWDYSLEL